MNEADRSRPRPSASDRSPTMSWGRDALGTADHGRATGSGLHRSSALGMAALTGGCRPQGIWVS